MKTLMKNFILTMLVLGTSQQALANSAGDAAGAILVSFAAAKTIQSLGVNSLERMELAEWKDDRTGTTAILGDSCGFYYEARIIGDVRDNYLWVTLKNNNTTQRSFNPIEVEFKFSDGVERRPDLFRFNEVFFEPGRLYNMILPFPSKEDFKNQQSLNVVVPFYGDGKKCVIPLKLVRNPKVADTLNSTASMDMLSIDMSYGVSNISGNMKKIIGDSRSVLGLNMNFYGPTGGGLYLGFRTYDSVAVNSELATAEALPASWNIQASEFFIGYTHRFIISQDSVWYLRGGIGGINLSLLADNNNQQDRYNASIFDLQAGYQHYFSRVKSGIWMGNYYWGVHLNDSIMYSSKTMKNGTKLDGNAAAVSVMIGVGI